MVKDLIIRRHRHSPEVAAVVGAEWAERLEPNNILVPASAAENAIAEELDETWLHPQAGKSPYGGECLTIPLDPRQGVPHPKRYAKQS